MSKIVKWLSKNEAIFLGLNPKQNAKNRNQNRYYISVNQWDLIQSTRRKDNRQFIETIRKIDKNGDISSTVEKLQDTPIEVPENFEIIKVSENTTTGQQWVQYAPKQLNNIDLDSLEEIIKKHSKPIKLKKHKPLKNKSNCFDTLTYTDVHIGMDTDKYDNTMYQNEWNEKELFRTAEIIIDEVSNNKKSNILVVDDLGDLLDGFNALTTRGGHHLPQNMTNEKAFDVALGFKMYLLHNLVFYYDEIIFNNICNDNHSGSFGYFVNSAFKQIAESFYKNIKVVNHRKFINHYFINDIAFLITHGKDDKALKFGFKVFPDANSIEKIDQYCKHHNIYKQSKFVVFKKGDSHQCLFDMCSSDDFYYQNYPALAPSSNWIKNNFKLGRRGFVLEHYKDLQSENKIIFIK